MGKAMRLIFECEIPGRPVVKKNTQRIVGVGKKKRAVYSPKFLAWQHFAILRVRSAMQDYSGLPIKDPCRAEFIFYFKDRQSESDVSNLVEGPQDVLQDAGVVENDRLFYSIHARKVFGQGEPRTEIKIYGGE